GRAPAPGRGMPPHHRGGLLRHAGLSREPGGSRSASRPLPRLWPDHDLVGAVLAGAAARAAFAGHRQALDNPLASRLRRAEIAALALADADTGLALVDQQIEGRRLAIETCQDGMGLAAVVGLVIEEMEQKRHQLLLDLRRAAGCAIAQRTVQIGLAES